MKQEKQEQGKKIICEGQEDHGDMGTDNNETGMQGQRIIQGTQGQMEGCWRCDGNRMDLGWE